MPHVLSHCLYIYFGDSSVSCITGLTNRFPTLRPAHNKCWAQRIWRWISKNVLRYNAISSLSVCSSLHACIDAHFDNKLFCLLYDTKRLTHPTNTSLKISTPFMCISKLVFNLNFCFCIENSFGTNQTIVFFFFFFAKQRLKIIILIQIDQNWCLIVEQTISQIGRQSGPDGNPDINTSLKKISPTLLSVPKG